MLQVVTRDVIQRAERCDREIRPLFFPLSPFLFLLCTTSFLKSVAQQTCVLIGYTAQRKKKQSSLHRETSVTRSTCRAQCVPSRWIHVPHCKLSCQALTNDLMSLGNYLLCSFGTIRSSKDRTSKYLWKWEGSRLDHSQLAVSVNENPFWKEEKRYSREPIRNSFQSIRSLSDQLSCRASGGPENK